MYLICFVPLVLLLNFHKHIVYPVYLMSQSRIFFTHVILQIDQLWCRDRLADRVLQKMLRVNFFLHVVGVLIFVLVIDKHGGVDFVVHWRLLVKIYVLTWNDFFCEALVYFHWDVLLWTVCLNAWDAFYVWCKLTCVNFLKMFVKLASISYTALVWNVVFYLVIKNLLRQLNLAFDFGKFINLRIILISANHHALFGILNKMSIISFDFKKFSTYWNHNSAYQVVRLILKFDPVCALSTHATLDF